MRFGVLAHPLDFGFGQAGRLFDPHGRLFARTQILGRYVQDAVLVDVELDLDLRHAARRRRNPFQVELAQQPVVDSHLSLALIDLDRHGRLAVGCRAERLLPFGRNRCVAFDQRRHDAAFGLDAQRQRRYVQQEHVLAVACQHAGLDRCADRHHFVRIDALVRFLAEDLADQRLNLGHPRRSADQDHFVDVARRILGVLQSLHHRASAALDQLVDQFFELGPRDRYLQMLGTGSVGRDERQIDVRLRHAAQLFLGPLAGFLQALQRHRVAAQIDAVLLLELSRHIVDQLLVEIVAAQMRIAAGADHLENLVPLFVVQFQDRDVEGAAAQVEHNDLFASPLVQPVGHRRGRRLVDDPRDLQTGDLSGVLRGLPLSIVEIGRHGDHGFVHLVPEVRFGRLFQLTQDLGGNFLRRVPRAIDLDVHIVLRIPHHLVGYHLLFRLDFVVPPSHEPLNRIHRVVRVGDRLAPRRFAHQHLAFGRERHHARRQPVSLSVRDHLRICPLHNGYHRIRCSQIDSDNFFALSHRRCSFLRN